MSTTARKIRKRRRHASLERAAFFGGAPVPPFQHPAKVGTPIGQRAASMQQTDRMDQEVMSKLGLFSTLRAGFARGKNGRAR